jgi:cell division protein FtsB
MFTKVLVFIKEFGILIAVGLALFFGYQGIFGKSGLKNLVKENRIRSEERAKYQELQDLQIKEKLEAKMSELSDSFSLVESHRQHIGVSSKGYHADIKKIEASDEIDEQIEEYVRISTKLVFPG